jgi:predicted dehydrogenase
MSTPERTIRYLVVGAGNIAQVAVLPAFQHATKNSQLVGVISGDESKLAELRKRYDLEAVGGYADLEKIIAERRIDAVYVATPNSLHREYSERAAAAGAHVLCEKPMAPNVEDCRAMASACESNRVKLMIAYRLHFEEANLSAIELARSGKLGEVRLFSSFFSQVVREDDIRQRPELAGGALYDLGVYCINAARNVFDAEPLSVFATSIERNGTDETTLVELTFPKDRLAQFVVSNGAAHVSSYRLGGTKGDLVLDPAYGYAEGAAQQLTIDGKREGKTYPKRDQFAPELLYFSDCILRDLEPEPSAEEGICDIRVIEAAIQSAKTRVPVSLPFYQRARRPSKAQEIHRPPLDKPETVNAPGPSVR